MRHEWIFDVLTDLKSYAHKNGLNGLVAAVDEAIEVAQAELRDANGRAGDGLPAVPPGGARELTASGPLMRGGVRSAP